ncbi:alpha/beta-hydrolase [Gymnopus androsaceus JB14]|uniref:Alpha/beta-hydrolase n=1 Tax=Gymnopus androsaceus JB14 TaxID=1447944 RepID=A0A6A4HDI6_9AGAR|nr:alpha/beta-hydrolase [Gymnopus androsaceus JB14]
MSSPPVVNVSVFDGQGTSAVNHSAACRQALEDASFLVPSLLTTVWVITLFVLRLSITSSLWKVFNYTTVRAIQKYISALRTDVSKVVGPEVSIVAAVPSLGPLPVPLQRSNSAQPPLFLFHDGSGLVNYYERVDSLDRDVWGIYNPKFSTGEDWSDVETMAAHYSKIITQTVSGPLLIGGWSFGGIVAFEAARQLLAQGHEVRGVLLIDSPSPIDHVPLSDSLIQGILSNGSICWDATIRFGRDRA